MNKVTINRETCKECGYCMTFCPKRTILGKSEIVNKKGYYPITAINLDDCIACGICAQVCPEAAIMVEKNV